MSASGKWVLISEMDTQGREGGRGFSSPWSGGAESLGTGGPLCKEPGVAMLMDLGGWYRGENHEVYN